MAGGGASSVWGPSPALVTALVALLGLGLAAYIVGPQLYWYAVEALTATAMCPSYDCNCDARPLLDLPEGAPPAPLATSSDLGAAALLRSDQCDWIVLPFAFVLLSLSALRASSAYAAASYYRILLCPRHYTVSG